MGRSVGSSPGLPPPLLYCMSLQLRIALQFNCSFFVFLPLFFFTYTSNPPTSLLPSLPSLSWSYSSFQNLESLSWQHEGQKFISSHADSSIYYWSAIDASASEGPIQHYAGGKPL